MLEPFICPGIFEDWRESTGKPIVDEWTLSEAMGANLEKAMTEHYETFITEQVSISHALSLIFGHDRLMQVFSSGLYGDRSRWAQLGQDVSEPWWEPR